MVAKRHSGLTIRITSFINSHKYRELSDLSIRVTIVLCIFFFFLCDTCTCHRDFSLIFLKGVVVFENLAGNSDSCDDVMRDMLLDDVVQGHSPLSFPTPCPPIIAC